MYWKRIFLLFLVLYLSVQTQAKADKYRVEVQDLNATNQRICRKIMKSISTYDGEFGYYYIPDICTCSKKELAYCLKAINQTYFPYKGSLTKDMYYSYYDKNQENKVWSVDMDVDETRDWIQINQRYSFKVYQLTRKCTNEDMSSKQKAKAIGKFIGHNTRYVRSCPEADSILRKRVGNCLAMSQLYKEMCHKVGIKSCRLVTGYYENKPHAWCTLKINGKQYYSDISFYTSSHKKKFLLFSDLSPKYHIVNY